MRSSRKRFCRFGLSLILVPASIWALVVALLPTGWARERVADALERATRQPVHLEALRLSVFGGVRLLDLQIGAEADPEARSPGPWLSAREVRLDVSLSQLLSGRLKPTRCRASGVRLRVARRPDGSFEFGDLLARDPQPPREPSSADDGEDPPLTIELSEAMLTVLDAPTGTRLVVTDVAANGRWSDDQVEIDRLSGLCNDGQLDLAARLERGGDRPRFEGELRVVGAGLDSGLGALGYLVPALGGTREALDGRLDLDLQLRGQGATSGQIAASLTGQGSLAIREINLDACPMLAAVAEAFRQPTRGRLGSIRGDFLIADRRVVTRNLTAQVGPVPILMVGWTDFDGRLDYALRLDHLAARVAELAERLSPEARQPLAELQASIGQATQLRLQGTGAQLMLTADGVRVDEWVRRAADPNSREFQSLRQLGRRLRDHDSPRIRR